MNSDRTHRTRWISTGHRAKVFPGLFRNPDDRDLELFLQEDVQTRRTPIIKAFAAFVNDRKDDTTLAEIYAVLRTIDQRKQQRSPFFTRTAERLLCEGSLAGCTQYAIAFATLARAKGIPAIVVDSAAVDWIESGASIDRVKGRFFVEAFVEGRWWLIDAANGRLYDHYDRDNWNLPGGYIAFSKALSVVDVGVSDVPPDSPSHHNLLQRVAFLRGKISYLELSRESIAFRALDDRRIFLEPGKELLSKVFLDRIRPLRHIVAAKAMSPEDRGRMMVGDHAKAVALIEALRLVSKEDARHDIACGESENKYALSATNAARERADALTLRGKRMPARPPSRTLSDEALSK